jgi:hypothetical protein
VLIQLVEIFWKATQFPETRNCIGSKLNLDNKTTKTNSNSLINTKFYYPCKVVHTYSVERGWSGVKEHTPFTENSTTVQYSADENVYKSKMVRKTDNCNIEVHTHFESDSFKTCVILM